MSSSKGLRKHYTSASSCNSESTVYPSSIFIDPIESRNIIIRRNKNLDLSLLNQAKTLSNLALSSSTSRSDVFSSSPLTWRNDFSKVFENFQTLKTPSYRETVHPPLSNELPGDIYQNLYDVTEYQPLPLPATDLSQKLANRRRSSAITARYVPKARK
jgi:hypothetical protein